MAAAGSPRGRRLREGPDLKSARSASKQTEARVEAEDILICLSNGFGSAPATLPPSVGKDALAVLVPYVVKKCIESRQNSYLWYLLRRSGMDVNPDVGLVGAERPCGGWSTMAAC